MSAASDSVEAASRMLIVGLGNPGQRYADTRHNLGFRVVTLLVERLSIARIEAECNALTGSSEEVILARPQTFMNRSGYSVRCLADRHQIDPGDTLVVYDDIALDLGRIRVRAGGSAAGHRGMESVINNLRTDAIPRLRLGIAASGSGGLGDEDLSDFVTAPFDPSETDTVEEMVIRAADACQSWIENGVEATMNRFNS